MCTNNADENVPTVQLRLAVTDTEGTTSQSAFELDNEKFNVLLGGTSFVVLCPLLPANHFVQSTELKQARAILESL